MYEEERGKKMFGNVIEEEKERRGRMRAAVVKVKGFRDLVCPIWANSVTLSKISSCI